MKPDRIQYGLTELPNWQREEHSETIYRTFNLTNTPEALELARMAALTAESLGSRPAVEVHGAKVTVRFAPRPEDELNAADITAARELDSMTDT